MLRLEHLLRLSKITLEICHRRTGSSSTPVCNILQNAFQQLQLLQLYFLWMTATVVPLWFLFVIFLFEIQRNAALRFECNSSCSLHVGNIADQSRIVLNYQLWVSANFSLLMDNGGMHIFARERCMRNSLLTCSYMSLCCKSLASINPE